jgi:predicted Zn-dependent protease
MSIYTCLHEIADVHYECSRSWRDIDPLIIMEDLEAADVVLKEQGEEAGVGMPGYPDGEFGLRAWRIVMEQYHLPFVALYVT